MSSEPVRAHAIEAPRQKLGRYELIGELASGGMGVVYLGRLQGVGGFERMFAIKVLHKHLAEKPQIVSMLLNEARLAAQIQHPNVVSTVDAEVSSNGQYYVVMEYVDGFTLCELLDHPTLDAVRRVRLGLRVLLDAMAGLDAAHRLCSPCDGTPLGIVHRDVSPTNILVSLQGAGMIADFGIASATAGHEDPLPGVVKGTPCYMAPEQLAGTDTLDARADVFSLGAVLWEVLTGEQLFYSPGGISGVFELVKNGEIAGPSCRNSRIPAALDAVCLNALERDLQLRYQSARELFEDLERVAREHDLIASTHETAEALSQLFADQIERRRSSLPGAAGVSSSALHEIPEGLRGSAPPPARAARPAPATAATPPVPAVSHAVDEPAKVKALPRRRLPWLLVALSATAFVAVGALTWMARVDGARSERAAQARAAAASAAPGREAAPPVAAAETVLPSMLVDEPSLDGIAAVDGIAPAQPEPVVPTERVRGRDRDRAFTSTMPRRSRVQREPAPRAARAAAPALPPGIAPFDPTGAQAAADDAEDAVLETNPYLMQR